MIRKYLHIMNPWHRKGMELQVALQMDLIVRKPMHVQRSINVSYFPGYDNTTVVQCDFDQIVFKNSYLILKKLFVLPQQHILLLKHLERRKNCLCP